ncbi:A disintegrin and metalloproteinase with thrombospondin motifs 3 [Chelonia mydas]|uniref:A disintegrin and metalloproteinase with thrombospondin motifs 3 n=1 Tax=Chelonia mydas TaxID=8469 RepID=M7BQS6_CHEMY|nr:A disintegrin and metalloproteinase with thrombospondin motifs 3 [Chelonia mydas]
MVLLPLLFVAASLGEVRTSADEQSLVSPLLSPARLKPNTHLVAPEAVVEWYEDAVETGNGTEAGNKSQTRSATERIWKKEPLWTNCAYVGDITDIPGASVAISNCDGLVSNDTITPIPLCFCLSHLFWSVKRENRPYKRSEDA